MATKIGFLQRSASFHGLSNVARKLRRNSEQIEAVAHGRNTAPQDEELDEELLEQIELENRVKQWLKSSGPPDISNSDLQNNNLTCNDSGASRKKLESSTLKRSKSLNGISVPENFDETTLFHPDFADWKQCNVVHTSKKSDSPDLFGLIHGAQNTLTRIFSSPN
jgi:hypothetical protein